MKSACIRSCSGPHFPAFGLNTERCGVSVCIQSEFVKIRTRITPNTDTFHKVYVKYSTIPDKTFGTKKVNQAATGKHSKTLISFFCATFHCNCQKFYFLKGDWSLARRFYLTGDMTKLYSFIRGSLE